MTFYVNSGSQLLRFVGATSTSSDIDTAIGNVSLTLGPIYSSSLLNLNFDNPYFLVMGDTNVNYNNLNYSQK